MTVELTVRRTGRPEWGFRAQFATGWYHQPSPPGNVDINRPHELVPLAVFTLGPDYSAGVATIVAARPKHDQGSVAEWLMDQCAADALEVELMQPGTVKNTPAMTAVARGENGRVALRMWEDGGRLITLASMAPHDRYATLEAQLLLPLDSFELIAPMGSSVPLMPSTSS